MDEIVAPPDSQVACDVAPPDATPPDATPLDGFAALRAQCDTLIADERIDKAVALGIIKLFHSAETMLREQHFASQQEAEKLRHDLHLLEVTHRHNSMVESLASDTARLKQQHTDDVQQLSQRLSSCQSAIEGLQQKKR